MMQQKNKGFTLIEVLIAAVILFSTLAITAELYSASSLSANKVIKNSQLSQASIVAVQAIKAEIHKQAEQRRLSEHSGRVLIMGVEFQWVANRESYKTRAREPSDDQPPRKQFSLFNVEVTPVVDSKQYRLFSFKVATW